MVIDFHHWRRVSLGLGVSLAVSVTIEALPSMPTTDILLFGAVLLGPGLFMAMFMFLSALAGAIATRINFVGPAVAFAIVYWVLTVNLARILRELVGPVDVFDLAIEWSMGLLLGVVGAVIGAIVGRRFSKRFVTIA